MISKTLSSMLIAILICLVCAPCIGASITAIEQNERLGRAVNIIGYDPIWRSQSQARFQAKHFKLIKEAGFQTVRINLHPFKHMDVNKDYALKASWWAVLDWAVDNALKQDLMVILDMHEFNAIAADPEARKGMFLAFWRQVASHCKDLSDNVVFEILNEPNGKLTPVLWNQWLAEALAIIRKDNPQRTVIVGPAFWNSVDHLDELILPQDDRNLIVTVHYYKPMEFTHQGASWSSHRDKSDIQWLGTDQDMAPINRDFDKVQTWSKKTKRPILLGEFGAYDKAGMPSRVQYTNAIARAAEARGWSWAYWQFDSDFIVYDIDRDQWVEPILKALIPSEAATGLDWPNWRGPQKNGLSKETDWSANWPSEGPTVLWQKQVGTGFSSMAVSQGRVYTLGNTGVKDDKTTEPHKDVVYCFDAKTGAEIWHHTYLSDLVPNGYEGGTSTTPTVADGRVYTLSKHGLVFCLDAVSGKVLWHRDLVKDLKIELPTWGLSSSPLLVGDTVVLNAGTHGLALSQANGSLVWLTGTAKAGYSTPVEYQVDGLTCLAVFGMDTLAGINAQTGELLWDIPWKSKYDQNIADPIIHNGQMFVSSFLGSRCSLFEIQRNQLKEVWQHKDMLNWLNSSVLWQGYVYGIDAKDKSLKCLELKTGAIKWNYPGMGLGSLMIADGKLIVLSETGQLLIAKASPEAFKPTAAANILEGKCWTVPVLSHGRIYARNAAGHLVCLDVSLKEKPQSSPIEALSPSRTEIITPIRNETFNKNGTYKERRQGGNPRIVSGLLAFDGSMDGNRQVDPQIAVGGGYVLHGTNSGLIIYDKEGHFVQGVNQNCFNGGIDPKLFFDPHNRVFGFDLWTYWDEAKLKPVNISVSETSDPRGAWNTYPVSASGGRDGGGIGYSRKWIGYSFPGGPEQTFVLKMAEAKAGVPATVYHFPGSLGHPVATQDAMDDLVFFQVSNTHFTIRRVTDRGDGTPQCVEMASAPHGLDYIGFPPQSPQKGTDQKTSSGDRNPKNLVLQNGYIWFSQAVRCNGKSAVQWHQVRLDGTIVQTGLISDPATNYIQTTMAVNKNEDVLVGFQETNETMYISPRLAWRRSSDAPGQLRDIVALGEGQGATDGVAWGDYSGSVVDGDNLMDLWTIQSITDTEGKGDTIIVKVPFVETQTSAESADVTLARAILANRDLPQVLTQARDILKSGLNAGSGYGEVWIRDLNTFIELALDAGNQSAIREALLVFFHFQGADGNIIDGYIPTEQARVGYKYIESKTKPQFKGHKNTVETDQESSLIQAVTKYVRKTGDRDILTEQINGVSVSDRLAQAMTFLLEHRFSQEYGLLWGATTSDWGDVQPEHSWGVELDENSHRSVDIYDNAMFIIAINDYLGLVTGDPAETGRWEATRDRFSRNVRTHLWDTPKHKFRPHLYLNGSPFAADFDEDSIYYHGGTATAIEAGLLTKEEILLALTDMIRNKQLSGAASIGLTVYPPYPHGFFQNKGMGPYSYQNGGDWTWFGGRMIQQLVVNGYVEQAYQEILPMVQRVIHNKGFFEWYTVTNEPRGSGTFRGSAGVLGRAIEMLLAWAEQHDPA